VHWTRFKVALGQALQELPTGDLAANLEEAIAAVQDAMTMYQRLAESALGSEARAMSRKLLGKLYLERVRGKRAENIEAAIAALEPIVGKLSSHPDLWADAMMDLGFAYWERMRGDRAENLERALASSCNALEVLSPEKNLTNWCRAMLSRAFAFGERRRGIPEENLEQALAAAGNVLRAVTREVAPLVWATAMHTRGTLLRRLVRGGRAENQEEAIAAFVLAREVFTREASPADWANCMFSLGAILVERLRGDRRSNLEAAARALTQALEVLSPDEDPALWAQVMNSLGTVYAESARIGAKENLERAIDAFGQVLTVLPRERDPEQWARTTRNLGIAYLDQLEGDRADSVDRAIAAFGQALEVFTRPAASIEWAETLLDLGFAYQVRLRGDGGENMERAHSALEQALEVFTLDAFPSRHATVQRALGHLRFDGREWAKAWEAYGAALDATGLLYGSSVVPDARQFELAQSQGVPARAAYALARLGRMSEAVTLLEQQAAQALSQVLARNEAALRDAVDMDRDAFSQARARIDTLEAAARREGQSEIGGMLTVVAELQQAHRALRTVAERIRAYVPQFMTESMTFAEIGELVQELRQPLVYLITTSHGSLALVVLPGAKALTDEGEGVLWLDKFTSTVLNSFIEDRPSGKPGYLHVVAGVDDDVEPTAITEVLDEACPLLEQSLMSPVALRLSDLGYDRAVLIARGHLALLPLHAVTDRVSFTFTPSARALQTARRGEESRAQHPPLFLGVGNPLPTAQPLHFAGVELQAVASNFAKTARRTLPGAKATRVNLLHAMPGATHVHFACHAQFDNRQPLMSWLGLAGEDRLTLLDLLEGDADLSAARLVVLSACQTGLADFRDVPSEAIGFPAAFLQRGVPCVVGALWPVDDISTAMLMKKFYELLLRGDPKDGSELPAAEALQRAQRWLRGATAKKMRLSARLKSHYLKTGDVDSLRWMDYYTEHPNEQPFEHPFYWAGFTVTGV